MDRDRLLDLGEELKEQAESLTRQIYELAGTEFNINSPKQLAEILYDKLGLPVLKKTKTGYSTSADVLEKLAPQHEIVEKILHYRVEDLDGARGRHGVHLPGMAAEDALRIGGIDADEVGQQFRLAAVRWDS